VGSISSQDLWMPFVDVNCENHGKVETFSRSLSGVSSLPCPECGERSRRVWSFGGFSVSFRHGYDEGAGKYFDTARQRDNFLAEKGMRKR
jgi:predicted nucleic acid-binding Zn ribbon protein